MESWGSGAVNCGVGSIVWVRRRNGSWWPGKIMGPDELSATHLVSPRTGTPVKLLGREDASVDWYNLEKSKRVKAFRCGEFDECIERAESSLGMPAKKREKYARREDAILHALELEKQLLEKEQGQLIASDVKSRKFSNFVKKKLVTSSKSFSYANGNLGNAKPDQCSTGSDSSPKDEKVSPFYLPKDKEGNQLGLRVVKSGLMPRNRGLQDFGLKATDSKRKFCSGTSNGSQRPTADDQTYASSYNGASMGGTSHANSRNILDVRKRPNERLTEDILVKRRDRRRPIVQVLQSSATLSPHLLQSDNHTLSLSESGVDLGNISRAKRSRCVYLPSEFSDCLDDSASVPNQMETYVAGGDCRLPGSLIEENPCEFIEDEQSESSETEDLDTNSDGETNTLSGSSDTDSDSPGGSEVQGKHESVGNDELDELEVSGDLSNICPYDHAPANAGVSKWQIKGKRNVRYFTKKLGVGADVKGSTGFNDGTYMEEKGTSFNRSALEHGLSFNHRSDGFNSGLNEAEKINKGYRTQATRLDNGGYTSTSKAASNRRNRTGHDIMDWEDLAWEDQLSFPGYLDAGEYLDPVFVGRQHLGGRMRTMLIDVDLKVQASYKKEHVPIVSLMSKIDGKAIIGHPIQIEVLREGFSSEILFSSKNDFDNEIHYNEGDRTLPPVWRTARRTANCRVPRPQLSSALDSDEAAELLPHLGQERKPPFKKPNAWGFRQKESMMSKDLPLIPRPPTDRKLSRKLPKRASLPSSQKTRTLSSIGVEQKLRHPRHDTNSYLFDGLIKTDSVVTPVACIPVKLVFSRLYEAVGRPPSIASTANHEALINMDTETNPL